MRVIVKSLMTFVIAYALLTISSGAAADVKKPFQDFNNCVL